MELVLVAAALALLLLFALLRAMRHVYVMPGNVALLARNGGDLQTLTAGSHRYFDPSGTIQPLHVKLGAQALPAQQLEVISSDRFAFRITVTPIIEVEDARLFAEGAHSASGMSGIHGVTFASMASPERAQPLLAQAATRAVAALTLEQFLDNPVAALDGVTEAIAPALPGAKPLEVALTSITLPPELRKMFTEVERAKREGLAGLERARAEQASLRALANAARNLADNPHLSQLRMLQVMENARGAKTFVLGHADELASSTAGKKAEA